MAGKAVKEACVFIDLPCWSAVITVIGAEDNVVCIYFSLDVDSDTDKDSFCLLWR